MDVSLDSCTTSLGATGPRKKFDDMFSRLDTIHYEHDRQTDRRTDRQTTKTALIRITSRNKNITCANHIWNDF